MLGEHALRVAAATGELTKRLHSDPYLAPAAIDPGNLPDPGTVLAAARGPGKIPVAWMK